MPECAQSKGYHFELWYMNTGVPPGTASASVEVSWRKAFWQQFLSWSFLELWSTKALDGSAKESIPSSTKTKQGELRRSKIKWELKTELLALRWFWGSFPASNARGKWKVYRESLSSAQQFFHCRLSRIISISRIIYLVTSVNKCLCWECFNFRSSVMIILGLHQHNGDPVHFIACKHAFHSTLEIGKLNHDVT